MSSVVLSTPITSNSENAHHVDGDYVGGGGGEVASEMSERISSTFF